MAGLRCQWSFNNEPFSIVKSEPLSSAILFTHHLHADTIYGTREDLYNDQNEYIGWRCWQEPSNCVIVYPPQ